MFSVQKKHARCPYEANPLFSDLTFTIDPHNYLTSPLAPRCSQTSLPDNIRNINSFNSPASVCVRPTYILLLL